MRRVTDHMCTGVPLAELPPDNDTREVRLMADSMRYSAGPFQSDMVKRGSCYVSEKWFDGEMALNVDEMFYSLGLEAAW
jgi:hypothetical protein